MPKISPNTTRICKVCGQMYHPKSSRQQSCNSPIEKICVVCGKTFDSICTVADTKQTCSKTCQAVFIKSRREASAKLDAKVCKWCGKLFTPTSVRDVYCRDVHYQTCEVCGTQFEIDVRRDPTVKTCSKDCRYLAASAHRDIYAMRNNLIQTFQNRYGVDNAAKIPGIMDKIKSTNLEKYGCEWYSQTDEYKDKVTKTDLEKYGVKHHLSSPTIMSKRAHTVHSRYGVDNVFQSDDIKQKSRETSIEKYGTLYPVQSPQIQAQIKHSNELKYGVAHPMMLPEYQEKQRATNFARYGYAAKTQSHIQDIADWYLFINDPRQYIQDHYDALPRTAELAERFGVDTSTIDAHLNKKDAKDCIRCATSLMEEEISQFIQEIKPGCHIIHNIRKLLDGLEIDIYLPEYKFGIECNPTATHNSSFPDPWGGATTSHNYHKRKTDKSIEAGIYLMHIFGYEWKHKKDIMKSMIANVLQTNIRIYARKCDIVFIDAHTAREFLESNHRQGFASASIYLGLKYHDGLIAVMTFGKMRHTIGQDSSELSNCYELVRFCSKLNTTVVGGAAKLFKAFVKQFNPNTVRSFSDRAHTRGKLYETLGFSKLRVSPPNYVWVNVVDDRAYHRINAQKMHIKQFLRDDSIDLTQSERVIMESHGYARVFDSGTITWQWRSNLTVN